MDVIARADMGGVPADHFGWMKTPAPIASRLADWLAAVDATFPARDGTAA
ncbi:Alpha/beta hydrolase OS=Rhodanobacter lindaniclasticus OX=75310 GN=B1991_01140 PE=4 SV=1 [Rhodanobacter lindaniclasticus]